MKTTAQKVEIKENELQFTKPTNHRFCILTRAVAEKLLANYEASKVLNRMPSDDTIIKYAADMDSNKWRQDIDLTPVLIDKDMVLRGGQHRIRAFLKSGQTEMQFPVVFPASEEEIKRQDTNRNRSAVNNNDMAMSKKLHDEIVAFENLPERTIHTSGKILCLADNYPGLNDKSHANFKTKAEKRAFTYSPETIVKSIETYLPILQEIDNHAFPFSPIPDGHSNYARFAPFVAAFAKAYRSMDKSLWKKMVRLLTVQENQFTSTSDPNHYLASEGLMQVFLEKTEQNNPIKVDMDLRRVLSCLAAAHNNVNIKTIDLETYGYETFLK
jgi:hypothetical protein